MHITWYGTASILIETDANKIIFDPYMKYLPDGTEPQTTRDARRDVFRAQNSILITHGHLDHLSSIAELYQDCDCTIYLTETPYRTLHRQGFSQDKLRLIRPDDEIRFSDMTVHVYPGKHIHYDLGVVRQILSRTRTKEAQARLHRLTHLNHQYPEHHETVFFEVCAEGKRIQLMGSAELCDDVEYPTGADVLILPHQGRSDMDLHNQSIAERLQPRRILIDHYDDAFPPLSANVPVDHFCKKMSGAIPTAKLHEGVPILC